MKLDTVVWAIPSMGFFGQVVANAIDAPPMVDAPVPDCKDVYIIGMYDAPTYARTVDATKRADRRIIHWCGTDVLRLAEPHMLPNNAVHLCESEALKEELAEKGVEAEVVTFPTTQRFPVTPLPEKPVVGVYLGGNPLFYGTRIVSYLQDVFPDVGWHTYGVHTYQAEQMPSVVSQCSVNLRLTPHDGSANTAREFMEAGRRVVGTTDLPYVQLVKRSDLETTIRKLRAALKETEPDYEAAAFYHEFNSKERYLRDLGEAL